MFTDYLDAYTSDACESLTELDDGSGDEYEDGAFVGVMSSKSAGLPVLSCCLIGCADAACLRDVGPPPRQRRHLSTSLLYYVYRALPVVTITTWTKSAPGQAKVSTDVDTHSLTVGMSSVV